MKLITLLSLLLTQAAFSQISCRDAIVDSKKILGEQITVNDFSTNTFEDFNMTAEEFNLLETETQVDIYQKIMPLDVVLEDTKQSLGSLITRLSRGFMAYFYAEELRMMKMSLADLNSCSME